MAVKRSVYEKIASSKSTGGGNLIRDGRYRFVVKSLILDSKNSGDCFIAEFEVVESEKIFEDVEPNKPTSTCSYVVNLDGAGKLSAPGNIKAFILALLGEDEDSVSEKELADITEELTSENQPARGMLIADETWRKFSRSGKNANPDSKGRPPMVMNRWSHVPQTKEEVAERRKHLDK